MIGGGLVAIGLLTRFAAFITSGEMAVLHRPQTCISGLGASSLVGSSTTIEKTFPSVFESTPVHGDLPVR